MNESSKEGNPLLNLGGAHPVRFRDLLHRLFSMANQGFMRREFLQMASGPIREFLDCDFLEVRLEEAGRDFRCRAGADCDDAPAALTGQIMDAVLRGQSPAASPFSTRSGSVWTGDSSRPILLREGGRPDARALVIGGEFLSLAFVPVPVDERIRGVLHLGSRRADAFTRDDLQFFEAVGETLGVAVAFQAAQWALRERVKELDCLYGIAQATQRAGDSLEQQLQAIVELLPPAWQYPELTAGRITLDGRSFTSAGWAESPWTQRAGLWVGGKLRGEVQVVYSRSMPAFDEGPFLREERSLIDEAAHQVGLIVDRWEDAKAKAKLFHMLEQRRE